MSIEAIEAIEAFIHNREQGITTAQIKKRIEDFVEERERRQKEGYQQTLFKPRQFFGNQYYRREGETLIPTKVK